VSLRAEVLRELVRRYRVACQRVLERRKLSVRSRGSRRSGHSVDHGGAPPRQWRPSRDCFRAYT